MRRGIALVGVLVLVLTAAGVSHAVPLSTLLNGDSIIAGDKLFDSWSVVYYDNSDPTRGFNADNIDVAGFSDGSLNPGPGLDFTVSNEELKVFGDGIYAYIDLMFTFRVSVLDPTLVITDNTLKMGTASINHPDHPGSDTGIFIKETIETAPGMADLGSKEIEFSYMDPGGLTANLTDSAVFAPQNEIWVTKNILVWAAGSNDYAYLMSFTQRFSQSPVGVPEPGMLALLALGGLALLRFKRG